MAAAFSPPSAATSPFPPRSTSAVKTMTKAPAGTFLPGTKVQVGGHRVIIERWLSEGGFAHVYVVRVPRDEHKHELAVLKRVAVPDKEHLASMRTEVETMKKLKGHKHVVTYMDSHASQLKGGGYEVFLLMEFCSGGGLIDFMNTRLQHRLTEPEILKIFGDVAEGVACMHYLKPPLLHRDLKVENVLIAKSSSSGTPTYKLCDFGSTAPPRPAARTADEGRLIEEDVQKHTTMQYRSPEMIDVWRKQPIDEKADIWALGVFLYKLCYYTTPFEDVGQMAILNATFKYPNHPGFSDRLKRLIGVMLKEDPKNRPNIYIVIKEVCGMRGIDVPIKDIYTNRTHSEARKNESLPSAEIPMSLGLSKQAPQKEAQSIPDIAPMRRGRPTAPIQQATTPAAKPSPSPARGDPFAALDSKHYAIRAGAVDELSKRFPTLDDFSITHEKGGAFSFPASRQSMSAAPNSDLSQRVTNALADEVFAKTKPQADASSLPVAVRPQTPPTRASGVKSKVSELQKDPPLVRKSSQNSKPSTYTSTGVGSSPPRSLTKSKYPDLSSRSIWKVPDPPRASSQPRASGATASSLHENQSSMDSAITQELHRSKSSTTALRGTTTITSPISSRPSLEGHRPSQLDLGTSKVTRAKSAHSRQRPSSAYVSSNLNYLRDQESSRRRPGLERRQSSKAGSTEAEAGTSETHIDNDMEFLRHSDNSDRRPSAAYLVGHKKRSSLSGAKNLLVGRFGETFKRFEQNRTGDNEVAVAEARTPEAEEPEDELYSLSPIQGSEATPSKHSNDRDSTIDETEDLPPDMRRELERRRLSQEERRVAEAAAAYKARTAVQGGSGANTVPTRASTIQQRVQSLLDEGRQSPAQHKRTAEGYGHYTDSVEPSPEKGVSAAYVARNPIGPAASITELPHTLPRQRPSTNIDSAAPVPLVSSVSAPSTQLSSSALPSVQAQPRLVSRPSVPPKSAALRTGGAIKGAWPPPAAGSDPEAHQTLSSKPTGGLAALLAKDLEGVPEYPPPRASVGAPAASPQVAGKAATAPFPGQQQLSAEEPQLLRSEDADLEAEFSQRYPSLSGLEMVEMEVRGGGEAQGRTMREV